jgi:hypothetical protein
VGGRGGGAAGRPRCSGTARPTHGPYAGGGGRARDRQGGGGEARSRRARGGRGAPFAAAPGPEQGSAGLVAIGPDGPLADPTCSQSLCTEEPAGRRVKLRYFGRLGVWSGVGVGGGGESASGAEGSGPTDPFRPRLTGRRSGGCDDSGELAAAAAAAAAAATGADCRPGPGPA